MWVAFHGVLTINKIYQFAATNKSKSREKTSISKKQTSRSDFTDESNNNNVQFLTSKKTFSIYEENNEIEDSTRNNIVLSKLIKEMFAKTVGYLLIGLLFVVFVYVNNGIVVGDREEHTVNANFPQILYFVLFTGIFTIPHLISQLKQIANFTNKNKVLVAFIFLINTIIVRFNTVAHHYNLTDKHHVVHHFLIFSYNNPLYALYLVPLYTVCSLFVIQNSIRSFGKFMSSVFIFTLAVNLIPQLLLEFRYFVPGFLFFRMRLVSRQWKILLSEFAIYFLINLIMISLYIVRPILFLDEVSQIFIW